MSEIFKIDMEEHTTGDEDCQGCWGNYPVECECGGLMHAEFGDEMNDGYWLHTRCDKCEDSE